MRVCGAWLVLLLVAFTANGAVITIEEAKEIDSGGDSELDGTTVTVTGVVTTGSGIFSGELSSLDAYIQDKTGGINLYTRTLKGIRLRLGDSVVVTGAVSLSFSSPNAGTIRLNVGRLEDIKVVGKGTVPEPVLLTASEVTATSAPPFEPYEGALVRVQNVGITGGDWPTSPGTNRDLTVEDATGSFTLRIDGDTDIGGTPEPDGPFTVIGVVVQNDRKYPYLSDYTVWPRSRYEDVLAVGSGSGIVVLEPSSVDNDLPSFDLVVTLAGNEQDTITAFSVDLPLADGWSWEGGAGNVVLSGPGLSGATYDVTASGVAVQSCAVWDGDVSYGSVTLKNVAPPAGLVSSQVTVRTSVDGTTFKDISLLPALKAVYPIPGVYITEVFPDDGTTSGSNAFIELHNTGSSTAYLEGYAICEQRAVSICDTDVRHVFGPADTLAPDEYLVLVESSAGFGERFDYDGAIEAAISPLGRVGGDGGLCGGAETYEVISFWRDASLSDLVDYIEYKDGVACPTDMCDDFMASAFPQIPPAGYALATGLDHIPENPPASLTAVPTPGAENIFDYRAPVVDKVMSHATDIVEVFFSEGMAVSALADPGNFQLCGRHEGCPAAVKAYPSASGEKVLLLFDDVLPGAARLEVANLKSKFNQAMEDTVVTLSITSSAAMRVCTIQAYDEYGFSPVRDTAVFTMGFITVPPGVFQEEYSSLYVQGLDGCGVNVFSYDVPNPAPVIGDFVTVSGDVTEYVGTAGSTTEIYMSPSPRVTILSRGYPEPDPVILKTGDVGREINEGRLVQTEGAIISTSDFDFFIDDGTGGIQVYQNYLPIDFTRFKVGMYARVKGVVLQYDYTRPFLESYELVPRYDSDIEIIEGAFPDEARLDVDARVFCPSCGEDGFSIRFGGESLSDVVLRLFDAAGRSVATLYSGTSLGDREIRWDGKDDEGRMVAPGLYICFLEVTESVTGRRTTESVPIVVGIELK
ncbi:MAG: hypothetical protein ABIJ00_00750 [Candidatus Eisenbacteria bacterium]